MTILKIDKLKKNNINSPLICQNIMSLNVPYNLVPFLCKIFQYFLEFSNSKVEHLTFLIHVTSVYK